VKPTWNIRVWAGGGLSLLVGALAGSGCDRKTVAGSSATRPSEPRPSYMAVTVDDTPKEETDPAKLLARALLYGDAPAVNRILAKHRDLVDKPVNKFPPLWRACERGSLELVKAVVENGANVNQVSADRHTPLMAAVAADNVETVKYLIARGADVHFLQGETKSTPLWAALSKPMTNLLIDAGIDPKYYNLNKETAMHQACRRAHTEVVEALLDRGFPIEQRDGRNMTPLHAAVSTGWADARPTVALLLRRGANLQARGYQGHTVLHECAIYNLLEMADFLLKRGAANFVEARDDSGRTPLETAEWVGKEDRRRLIALLINNGAKGIKQLVKPDEE
jgi:ankyrin repeat protein